MFFLYKTNGHNVPEGVILSGLRVYLYFKVVWSGFAEMVAYEAVVIQPSVQLATKVVFLQPDFN